MPVEFLTDAKAGAYGPIPCDCVGCAAGRVLPRRGRRGGSALGLVVNIVALWNTIYLPGHSRSAPLCGIQSGDTTGGLELPEGKQPCQRRTEKANSTGHQLNHYTTVLPLAE